MLSADRRDLILRFCSSSGGNPKLSALSPDSLLQRAGRGVVFKRKANFVRDAPFDAEILLTLGGLPLWNGAWSMEHRVKRQGSGVSVQVSGSKREKREREGQRAEGSRTTRGRGETARRGSYTLLVVQYLLGNGYI
jgi:hypothetical protein